MKTSKMIVAALLFLIVFMLAMLLGVLVDCFFGTLPIVIAFFALSFVFVVYAPMVFSKMDGGDTP